MSLIKDLAYLFKLPDNSHELVIHVTNDNNITVECIAFYEGEQAASVFKKYGYEEKFPDVSKQLEFDYKIEL